LGEKCASKQKPIIVQDVSLHVTQIMSCPVVVYAGKQGGIADLFVPCMFVHTRDFFMIGIPIWYVQKQNLIYRKRRKK